MLTYVDALGQAGEGVLPAVGRGGRGFRRAPASVTVDAVTAHHPPCSPGH